MKNKILTVSAIILMLVVLVLFAMFIFQRNDRDIFIKVAILRYQGHGNFYAHYFVVGNDGTFTSYYGRVRNHDSIRSIRRRNFLSSIQEKEVVLLGEQDFQNISELVSTIVAIENRLELFHGEVIRTEFTDVTLYHKGTIYGGANVRSRYFQELTSELVQLSPLSVSWNYSRREAYPPP